MLETWLQNWPAIKIFYKYFKCMLHFFKEGGTIDIRQINSRVFPTNITSISTTIVSLEAGKLEKSMSAEVLYT